MLKMVDGTGIIGVDMICPLGVSTPQPPNYDRVELEGVGMLVLPNSLDAPLERLELGGKTEQVQTSGKNLFNGKILAGKYPTDDMNIYEDKPTTNIFDKPVEIKPDTEYIISADGRLVEGNIYIYDEAGKKITEHYSGKFTSPSNAKYVVASGSNTYMTVNSAVQIEYGSTISSYEPYTGGKPSPSPEYPQEIKNVGKWNEETRKYEVDVKVVGKNLFNREKAKDESNWKRIRGYQNYPIYVGTGNKVTFSYLEKLNTGLPLYFGVGFKESSISEYMYHATTSSLIANKKTLTATGDYAYLIVSESNVPAFHDAIQTFQVEISPTQTNYQPYKEQTLTITSDRPITKWDRLVEQGGQIGWLYKSTFINGFNGDGYTIKNAGNIGSVGRYIIIFPDALIKGNASDDIYVDKYRGVNAGYAKEEYGICCNWNDGSKYFNAPNENVKTLDDFKKWLTENPLTIAYETEKTTFVPLPQSEQNAIRALKTYYPTTVITADGGELDPDIKVTYRKEI